MIGLLPTRRFLALVVLLGCGAVSAAVAAPQAGQQPAGDAATAAPDVNPGQFFTIEEPINSDTLERIKAGARQVIARAAAQQSDRPILVFVFKPGQAQPNSSGFGTSFELANFISTDLAGAKYTVAYVPEPLKGYAVLPALACGEIVMGPESSLGPITPEDQDVKADYREPIRSLARRKGREADLYLGLLEPQADLKTVRTADRQVHYVLASDLPEFLKTNTAAEGDIQPAWEGGSRGKLTARRAREEGFVKLLADNPAEIANVYHIDPRAISNDPTLAGEVRPVWVQIDGRLDSIKEAYLRRRIDQARRERVNLLFFQINSPGGLNTSANNIAGLIADIKDMKTVAFIDDQATGVAAILPLACDDIVFRRGGRMGGAQQILVGRNRRGQEMTDAQLDSLARRASDLANRKGHPTALAQAMVDRQSRVLQVTDVNTGSSTLVLEAQQQAEPARYQNPTPIKEPGVAMMIPSGDAVAYHLGREVDDVEAFKGLYGVRDKLIRVDGPTWVDGLVTTLNDPVASWMLLFVGVFMLILEIKMPGVGLPAIASALAFLLFFWSRYLSGTADQLEILLFLVGLICLGLELFVFPGFGVFGLSGFVLILTSIVMASHTFVWPTQDYEYRQMAGTLGQIVAVMVGVGIGASIVGRYIPSLPVFNRMVLKPQFETGSGLELDEYAPKPEVTEGYESFAFLMGETGRTTTVLKPSGKAQFGNLLVDVRADGFYIDRGALIEVVEVQGLRVVVKPVG